MAALELDASQAYIQAVSTSYPSSYVDVDSVYIQEIDRRPAQSEVAQVYMQMVVQENTAYIFRSRAWGFTWDGHPIYVLTLGQEGTFCYDLSTEQWSQFVTEGHVTWDMENGTMWNNDVFAASLEDPIVWRFDNFSGKDQDTLPITGIVTGGVPLRGRVQAPCYGVQLTGSNGIPISPGTITLRISDDQGKTWYTADPVIDIGSADWTQPIEWRSLGLIHSPGRVFEITDVGGTVRIDGLDMDKPE